jgi:hypothetical protein
VTSFAGGSEKEYGNFQSVEPYYRYVDLTVQMRFLASAVSERDRECELENQL